MTQEDKMLLIKDLSSRLPYAVHIQHISGFSGILRNISIFHKYDENDNIYDAICYSDFLGDEDSITIEHFKPYLFPISSMTEEQLYELKDITDFRYNRNTLELMKWTETHKTLEFWLEEVPQYEVVKVFDWLNKNHFDYRCLIERGLAIDATGLNIY